MRRRSRRAPNTSESTGKIGQELPSNQPAPLVPFYPEEAETPARTPRRRRVRSGRPNQSRQTRQKLPARDAAREQAREHTRRPAEHRQAAPMWNEPADSGRLEARDAAGASVRASAGQEPAERSPQAPKGYVVLAIGLPGSGKTTWFRRRGVTPLSSDLLRNILFDDVEEQRYQGLVFATLRSLLRARLIARMPWNYVDATNLSIHERPPVDQDGQELWLRGAGGVFRCAAGGMP